jgi:hypothetical protein
MNTDGHGYYLKHNGKKQRKGVRKRTREDSENTHGFNEDWQLASGNDKKFT